MKKALTIATAAILAITAGAAQAHEAGDLLLKVGAATVSPNDDSSDISAGGTAIPGSQANVNSSTQLGLTLAYMLTDNIGVELLAATPFNHRVSISGVAPGVDGKLADVKQLPPTLSLQYYPLNNSSNWQPYVGIGLNYTAFFSDDLTRAQEANGFSRLSLSNSTGLAAQVGSDWKINERYWLNASVWYIDINTTAKAQLGAAPVKVKVDVDPWVFMIGVGYRF